MTLASKRVAVTPLGSQTRHGRIALVVAKLPLRLTIDKNDIGTGIRDAQSVAAVLNDAIDEGRHVVWLLIGMTTIYFDPNHVITYEDWERISCTSFNALQMDSIYQYSIIVQRATVVCERLKIQLQAVFWIFRELRKV